MEQFVLSGLILLKFNSCSRFHSAILLNGNNRMRISTWQIFACLVYNNTCKYHQITFRIFVIMSFHKRITKKICSTPFSWYLWHTFTRDVSKTIWHFRYYGYDPKVIRAFCNLHILIVIFTYVRKISVSCTDRESMYRSIRFDFKINLLWKLILFYLMMIK